MRQASRALLAVTAALVAVACGGGEKRVVDQYFNAVRAKDNQTLASFAAVSFEQPVDSWKITGTSPETKSAAMLPDLVKKVQDIEAQIAANKKDAGAYSLDHYADIDQVKDLRKKGGAVPAKLTAVAQRWDEFNEKDRDLKRQLAQAKAAVEKEKRSATLSVGQLDDLEQLPGEVLEKKVDLDLTIKGQTKPYVMTLRKYELKREAQGAQRVISRWVVQELEPKA